MNITLLSPIRLLAAGIALATTAQCETILSTGASTEAVPKPLMKAAQVDPSSSRQDGDFLVYELGPDGAAIANVGTLPSAKAWVSIRTPAGAGPVGNRNGVRFIQQTDLSIPDSIQFHLSATEAVEMTQRILLLFEKDSWSALNGSGKARLGSTGEISFSGNNGGFQGGGARFAPVVRSGDKCYVGNDVVTIDKKVTGLVDADRVATSFADLGQKTFTPFDPSAPDFGGLDLGQLTGTVRGDSLNDITAIGLFMQYEKKFEGQGANEINIASIKAALEKVP
ncbi:MAG: hypothetical protein WCS65_03200 [Verrucomicrobiae bacterium]